MLFVPVWDLNPLKRVRFQFVTVSIITINIVVYFVFQTTLLMQAPDAFTNALAVKPHQLLHAIAAPILGSGPHVDLALERLTLISYMFLHGGVLHLFINMIFLFVFGDNVEDAMGHARFILFYLMCGVFAALAHCAMTTTPDAPLIGASGAISGVIGAYLMLHPNIRVWVLMPLPIFPLIPLRFSAAFVIGAWILFQAASLVLSPTASTAYWTHIGGFASGILLILFMRRPGVPLFDQATGV
jgi:membrane associated rhomboid family serine protease